MASLPHNNLLLFDSAEMDADKSSIDMDVSANKNVGLQIMFTGAPTGEFFVEASNDRETFFPMTFPQGQILAAGAAGSHTVEISDFPYKCLKVRYKFTSGNGVLTVVAHSK